MEWTPAIQVRNTASNNALFATLYDLADLPPNFLDNDLHYMLLGEFPRDPTEVNFGIYRQQFGGNV